MATKRGKITMKIKDSVYGNRDIEWTDDTSRVSRACKKCSKLTTGRVGRNNPRCRECTMMYAHSPIADLVTLLQRKADKESQ